MRARGRRRRARCISGSSALIGADDAACMRLTSRSCLVPKIVLQDRVDHGRRAHYTGRVRAACADARAARGRGSRAVARWRPSPPSIRATSSHARRRRSSAATVDAGPPAAHALGHAQVVVGAARRSAPGASRRGPGGPRRPRPASAATTDATRPPMPASTSSKIMRGHAVGARQDGVSASIVRDSSPPEATRASGFGSSPGFVRQPELDAVEPPRPDILGRRARAATSNVARSMPRPRSSRSTWPASRAAAARRRSDEGVGRRGQLRAAARPSTRSCSASTSSWRSSRSSSARRLVAEARASPPRVSPYLRLRRASASSRSSIASSRPGSTATPSRSRGSRASASSTWTRGAVERLARRGERRIEPAEIARGPGPRGPAGSAADCGASSSSAAASARPAVKRSACCSRRRSAAQLVLLARPQPRGVELATPGSAADPRAARGRARPPRAARPRPAPPGAWRAEVADAVAQLLGVGEAVEQRRAGERARAAAGARAGRAPRPGVAEPLEQADRDRRVVDERAVPSRAGELAPHDDLAAVVAGRAPPRRAPRAARRPPATRRRRASTVAVSASARMTSVWARAPRTRRMRVDQHRLAGAGLAGEHVQPGREGRR